jgi:hypothetical protein
MGATVHTRSPHETFAGESVLEVMCCPICGITYAVPESMLDAGRRKPDLWWYCPNGHHLHFPGKSESEKLEDEKNRRARLQAQLDQRDAQLRAQRGATTRARNQRDKVINRAVRGVCPCCNRSFKQLRRHMASKHPDYEHDVHAAD